MPEFLVKLIWPYPGAEHDPDIRVDEADNEQQLRERYQEYIIESIERLD